MQGQTRLGHSFVRDQSVHVLGDTLLCPSRQKNLLTSVQDSCTRVLRSVLPGRLAPVCSMLLALLQPQLLHTTPVL